MTTDLSTRRLVRRTDDRIVAGVASGVAAYLGIDPVLVRVVFVLTTFLGGVGLIAYAAIWLLAPEDGGAPAPVANRTDRTAGFWVAIALLLLGGLALADNVADRSLVWPVLLIGAGVALWRSDASRPEVPSDGPAAGPSPPGVPASPPAGSPPVPPPPAAPVLPWEPPSARRRRSPLGGVTVALALVTVGVLLLLDGIDVLAVSGATLAAWALLVLGVGLLVGSVAGRARWLALPAVFLVLPVLGVATVVEDLGLDLAAGMGQRQVVVVDVADVATAYEYGVGEFILDLSQLDLGERGGTVATEASLAIGQMTIVVPDEMTVVVDYEVALGDARLFGQRSTASGPDVSGVRTFEGTRGGGRLELEADLGLGQLVVLRDADAGRPARN